jgi:hypothetical protein
MNGRFHSIKLDDATFDRLVDGELGPADYKQLLAALDDDPALWRHCALAFLEAQAWRGEMSAIRRGQEMATASAPAAAAVVPNWRRWLPLLAVAASVLAAFLGGLAAQRQFDNHQRDAGNVARSHPPGKSPSRETPGADDRLLAGGQEPRSLGNIRLVVGGEQGTQPQQIDLPVYELDQLGAQWLAEDRPALPAEVIESLARRGRKVERQIEFLPLPLDDEHQVVVPVEQIQITPISRRSY